MVKRTPCAAAMAIGRRLQTLRFIAILDFFKQS